jgi:hypothetical protein
MRTAVVAALLLFATARTAAAGDETTEVTVSAGAGVQGFTGKVMRDAASPGGLWDLRIVLGPRAYIAFEGAYVGTAQPIDAPLGGGSATLVGSTVEVLARSNLTLGDVQPYMFIGGGATRYHVTQRFEMADSGMTSYDTAFEIPMGVGVTYRRARLLFDCRATGRLVTAQELVLSSAPGAPMATYAAMHTLGVTASLGYQF